MTSIPEDLSEMFEILCNDVRPYYDEDGIKLKKGIDKRGFARAVFACIEGGVHLLKVAAISSNRKGLFPLSHEQQQILGEQFHDLRDNGKIYSSPKYYSFKSMLKFLLDLYASELKLENFPDYKSQGWQCLGTAVDLRNRLTHPRSIRDLNLTDDQLKVFSKGFQWFMETAEELLSKHCNNVVEAASEVNKLQEELAKAIADLPEVFQEVMLRHVARLKLPLS